MTPGVSVEFGENRRTSENVGEKRNTGFTEFTRIHILEFLAHNSIKLKLSLKAI